MTIKPGLDKRVAHERKQIQDAYIRLCRDSGFRMGSVEAARMAGKVLGIHPIDVWVALGFDNMERIAAGTHQCLAKELPPRVAAAVLKAAGVEKGRK